MVKETSKISTQSLCTHSGKDSIHHEIIKYRFVSEAILFVKIHLSVILWLNLTDLILETAIFHFVRLITGKMFFPLLMDL